MKKYIFDEMFEKIEAALAASKYGFSVALLCNEAYLPALRQSFAERRNIPFVVLDGKAGKHILKRELNLRECEFIVYTREFEPVIYEIFNDGTTSLTASYLLQSEPQ